MLVSIQGIKGSYHHDVACALYGDDVNILECLSFDKMAESVFESKAQIGIMAIENSIAGSIIPNYAIIDKLNLKIVGEYYININHKGNMELWQQETLEYIMVFQLVTS